MLVVRVAPPDLIFFENFRGQVLKGFGWTPLQCLIRGGLSGSSKTSGLIKPPTFMYKPGKFPARATGSFTPAGAKKENHVDPLVQYGGSINHAISGSWYASIKIGKKCKWLGSFKTEREARQGEPRS